MNNGGISILLIPQNFIKILIIGLALGSVGIIDINTSIPVGGESTETINIEALADREKLKEDKAYVTSGEATSYEAEEMCTTIEVPVWKFENVNAASGSKISSTEKITVNKELVEEVTAIFTEIYNSSERFPMSGVIGYYWSENGGTGNHQSGSAIDVNSWSNWYHDIKGSHWEPGEDPYSMPKDGSVVKTFKKYGWEWGGDWEYPEDYMHFSCLGD